MALVELTEGRDVPRLGGFDQRGILTTPRGCGLAAETGLLDDLRAPGHLA